MSPGDRLGSLAAFSVALIGLLYLVVLLLGIGRFGAEPISGAVLIVMEILTMASAIAILIAIAWISESVADEQRLLGRLALVPAGAFFATTWAVHFIQLTARRQLGSRELVWPSVAYAAELLAWDGFLGLALVLAASALRGAGTVRWVRAGLMCAGLLALIGAVGPITGRMELQRIGILGYAVVLPVSFAFLGWWIRTRP